MRNLFYQRVQYIPVDKGFIQYFIKALFRKNFLLESLNFLDKTFLYCMEGLQVLTQLPFDYTYKNKMDLRYCIKYKSKEYALLASRYNQKSALDRSLIE